MDYDGLKNFLIDSNLANELESLTEQERQVLFQMAKEFSEKGSSNVLKSLWYEDYDEVPVDIDTFLDDPRYFGDVLEGSIYPYWREMLRNIFAPDSKYFEVIFSCLTGDTLISCSDGYNRQIKDIVKLVNEGKTIYVNSYNRDLGIYSVGRVINGVMNGCRPTWEIFLDNGKSFRATKEHKILMENNSWKETGELQIGDRFFPSKEGEESRKVIGKEYCAMLLPVYDIEVEITHNFILGCGCIVHNCLTEDTEIPCLDGKVRTIREIIEYLKDNKFIYLYSFDQNKHEFTVGKCIRGVYSGEQSVYKITLDNGKSFKATGKHKVLMRNNHWKRTDELKIGDSLMPFDKEISSDDREYILQPKRNKEIKYMNDRDKTYKRDFTHKLVYRWKMGKDILIDSLGKTKDIHHKNQNHRDNRPENLIALARAIHLALHGTPNLNEFNEKVKDRESEEYKSLLKRTMKGNKSRWANPEEHRKASERMRKRNLEGLAKKASLLSNKYKKLRKTLTRERVLQFFSESKTVKEVISKLGCSRECLVAILGSNYLSEFLPKNHKVVNIEYFPEPVAVYDIEVEGHHNFALNCGCACLNCSIGVGKSTIAGVGMAYVLYKLLCLKSPQKYYGLNKSSIMTMNFFNINLQLAETVSFGKFQSMITKSPWFLEHGTLIGNSKPQLIPNKGIKLAFGSNSSHALGQDVFCLSGDTKVLTERGIKQLDELEGEHIQVFQYNPEQNKVELSNPCSVVKSGEVKELIEIELEDRSIIKCTPEHRLMLANGEYRMAKDLTEEDELMYLDKI